MKVDCKPRCGLIVSSVLFVCYRDRTVVGQDLESLRHQQDSIARSPTVGVTAVSAGTVIMKEHGKGGEGAYEGFAIRQSDLYEPLDHEPSSFKEGG
jgi:hypothetical protein